MYFKSLVYIHSNNEQDSSLTSEQDNRRTTEQDNSPTNDQDNIKKTYLFSGPMFDFALNWRSSTQLSEEKYMQVDFK
jgi:hypothetical protein